MANYIISKSQYNTLLNSSRRQQQSHNIKNTWCCLKKSRWPWRFYVRSIFWDLRIREHAAHQILKKFCSKHFLIVLPEMLENWWQKLYTLYTVRSLVTVREPVARAKCLRSLKFPISFPSFPMFLSLFTFFFFFEKLITTRTDLDAKWKFVQERRGLSRVEMMQRLSIADRARLSTRTNGTVPLHIKHARIITETLRPVEVMQNDDDGFARLDCHRRSRSRANNRPR